MTEVSVVGPERKDGLIELGVLERGDWLIDPENGLLSCIVSLSNAQSCLILQNTGEGERQFRWVGCAQMVRVPSKVTITWE